MPSSSLFLLINGLFEHAVEDEHMKEFMKQNYNANPFPPISTYKLIKRLRMNRRDSGRLSPPLCLKPREISKGRHHRAFFNFLTLNDFIRKWVCTVSVYVWGRLGE